jgi:hypothetical protein
LATGGVTTAVFSGCGAGGFGVTIAAGFSAVGAGGGAVTTDFGGVVATGFAGATTGGLGGAGGCCCCSCLSRSSRAISPGLEILERSIFGFTSVEADLSLGAELDFAVKCLRTRSASSSSSELEWVFFSVTPTSSSTSRIALLFTSSSLARSLIRIFIRSVFPPGFLLRDHKDLTIF